MNVKQHYTFARGYSYCKQYEHTYHKCLPAIRPAPSVGEHDGPCRKYLTVALVATLQNLVALIFHIMSA